MSMFKIGLSVAAIVGLLSPTFAYENYIPLGTGYSTTVDSLPSFDSEEGHVSQRTDEYETEIYLLNKKRAEQDSKLRGFFTRRDSTGVGEEIDY